MRFFGIDGVVMQISRRLVEEIEIYICFFKRIIIILLINHFINLFNNSLRKSSVFSLLNEKNSKCSSFTLETLKECIEIL